jgi:hypothetical protein
MRINSSHKWDIFVGKWPIVLTGRYILWMFSTCWVWGPKGQMSEYPIPHGEHCEPCTLRSCYMVS